jgi:hypothetical protein
MVTLIARADYATSYIWRRGSEQLDETSDKLVINTLGTYTYDAKGVNISGTGEVSLGKTVTVTSCAPTNPTSVTTAFNGVNSSKIEVSWGIVTSATSYKVQICDNISMNGCEGSEYYRETSYPVLNFEESALYCGYNYFKVIAVNSFGESSGVTVSCNKPLSVTAPLLYAQYGALFWSYSHIKGVSNITVYYDVYRKSGDGEWNLIATTTGGNYTDSYSSNTEYVYYKIRAYITTSCGMAENYSNTIDV